MGKSIYAKDIDLIMAMKNHKIELKTCDAYDSILIEITPDEAERLARVYGRSLVADVSSNQKYCSIKFDPNLQEIRQEPLTE